MLGMLQFVLLDFQRLDLFTDIIDLLAQGLNLFPVIQFLAFEKNLKSQACHQNRQRVDEEHHLREDAKEFLVCAGPFQLFLFGHEKIVSEFQFAILLRRLFPEVRSLRLDVVIEGECGIALFLQLVKGRPVIAVVAVPEFVSLLLLLVLTGQFSLS